MRVRGELDASEARLKQLYTKQVWGEVWGGGGSAVHTTGVRGELDPG